MQQFFTVFTIGLSLARFWRAFGISGGGGLNTPTPPPYATDISHVSIPLVIVGLAVASTRSNDGPSNSTEKKNCSRLSHSTLSLSRYFHVCLVVYICTTLRTNGNSFRLLNKGLTQWPQKEHRYHSTTFLFLTQEQNDTLHTIIESSRKKHTEQY